MNEGYLLKDQILVVDHSLCTSDESNTKMTLSLLATFIAVTMK